MVAPVNWSNTPPSRFTFHPTAGSSDRPVEARIQSVRSISILSPRPWRLVMGQHAHPGEAAIVWYGNDQRDRAVVAP